LDEVGGEYEYKAIVGWDAETGEAEVEWKPTKVKAMDIFNVEKATWLCPKPANLREIVGARAGLLLLLPAAAAAACCCLLLLPAACCCRCCCLLLPAAAATSPKMHARPSHLALATSFAAAQKKATKRVRKVETKAKPKGKAQSKANAKAKTAVPKKPKK
jgi:hypothetical protein